MSSGLRIFAGLCLWRLPSTEELTITCGKLEKGEICFGELIELGIDREKENKKAELIAKADELKSQADELIKQAKEF